MCAQINSTVTTVYRAPLAELPDVTSDLPKTPAERGSQVSFHFQDGYAAMQALIDYGVIGDFRAPDMMRFGFTPLFIDEDDVEKACAIIENVMQNELWDRDEYKK